MDTTSIVVLEESEALEATWRFVQEDLKVAMKRRDQLLSGIWPLWAAFRLRGPARALEEVEIELKRLGRMLRALDRVRSAAKREQENRNG